MALCTTYKEVATFYGNTTRQSLRHWALNGLSLLARPTITRQKQQARIQFLYFHHVFEDEEQSFEALVAQLAQEFTFISHSEAVQRLNTGNIDKPYISWSSDDGLQNNLKAAKILKKYGAPCCFYINPNSIGLKDEAAINEFCTTKLHMPGTAFLNWDEVGYLLKEGHEIGSHTLNHDRVTTLSAEAFKEDLETSKTLLERYCGPIQHFAYPYGRFTDFSKAAYETVFATGYSSCATAVRGCHTLGPQEKVPQTQLFIRRDQVIGAWPTAHTRYFMAISLKNSTYKTNLLPPEY